GFYSSTHEKTIQFGLRASLDSNTTIQKLAAKHGLANWKPREVAVKEVEVSSPYHFTDSILFYEKQAGDVLRTEVPQHHNHCNDDTKADYVVARLLQNPLSSPEIVQYARLSENDPSEFLAV